MVAHGAEEDKITFSQVWEGCMAVLRHKWLFLKCSAIGAVVGIIPGVGGETSPFVAYAVAKQASRIRKPSAPATSKA